MNTLPTNYVDAVYSGNKKYAMTTNGDGTVSFTDQTSYTTQGTRFGAADVNAINSTVNELAELLEMTWSKECYVLIPNPQSFITPYYLVFAIPLDNVVNIKFNSRGADTVPIVRTYSSFPESYESSYVRQIFTFMQYVPQNTVFTPQSNEKYLGFIITEQTGSFIQSAFEQYYKTTYQAMKLR